MRILTPNAANSKTTNLLECAIHFVSFRPRLSCLSLNTPKFVYIWRILYISLHLAGNLNVFNTPQPNGILSDLSENFSKNR